MQKMPSMQQGFSLHDILVGLALSALVGSIIIILWQIGIQSTAQMRLHQELDAELDQLMHSMIQHLQRTGYQGAHAQPITPTNVVRNQFIVPTTQKDICLGNLEQIKQCAPQRCVKHKSGRCISWESEGDCISFAYIAQGKRQLTSFGYRLRDDVVQTRFDRQSSLTNDIGCHVGSWQPLTKPNFRFNSLKFRLVSHLKHSHVNADCNKEHPCAQVRLLEISLQAQHRQHGDIHTQLSGRTLLPNHLMASQR